MPFTLAHPAIILPLGKNKFRLSVTGLVAGSVAPDFEFFFQMREVENIGHHVYGILLFDIPTAILLCYVFHTLLKNLLVANMPEWFRSRFVHLLCFNWNDYTRKNSIRVILSTLIGILSHLFLDAFTHYDGLFVTTIPMLTSGIGIWQHSIPVYYLLQVIFSVAGLWFLHKTIQKLPVNNSNTELNGQNKLYWPLFFFILAAILIIRLAIWPEYNSFWSVVMAVMGGVCYALLFVSIILQYSLHKKIIL